MGVDSCCTLPPVDIEKKGEGTRQLLRHEACDVPCWNLGSRKLTCGGVVRECGDASCDGGFDADEAPDRLYPGQIGVPVGCNCRTCRGCMLVCFRDVLMA